MRLLVPVVIVLLASAAQAVTPLWRTDLPATCRFDNITTNVYRPTAPVFKPGSDLVYVATSCGPLHTGPTSVVGLKASTGETVVSTTLPGLSNPTALATFSNSGSYLLPVLNASHNPTIAQVDGTSATWTAPTEVTSGYIYDLQVVGDTVVYQLEDYALFFTKLSSPAPTATVYLRALSYSATDGTHFITAVGFPENYTGGVFVYDVNGSVISSLQLPVGAGVPCSRPVFKDASHSVFVVATSGQYTVLHVVSLTPSGTLTLLTSFPLVDQPVYPLYYLNSPWVQLAMSADSSLLYLMGAISISAYDVATQKNVFYTRSPSVIDPTISLGVSSSGVLVVRAFVGYTSTMVAAVNGTDGSVISLVSAGVPWAASALTPYVVAGNTLVVCSDYMTPQQDPSIQAYCAGFAL